MQIRIGTSGFSYDDWKGCFYPQTLPRGRMLEYYSGRFSTVEVNASYYHIPAPRTFEQMAAKVPEGFDFAVKAHSSMTHSGEFQPASFIQFREAVQPLVSAGMLGPVLAQFPWGFKESSENRAYLEQFREALPDLPIIVEFRNSGWMQDDVFELLRSLELGYCCVDEPRFKSLVLPRVEVTAPVAYIRFHGRNAEKWWNHGEAYERYNYLYEEDELREWIPRVEEAASRAGTTYVYFNNHYQGKAAHNARQMADLLAEALGSGVLAAPPSVETADAGQPLLPLE